jgi:hypothetical protein
VAGNAGSDGGIGRVEQILEGQTGFPVGPFAQQFSGAEANVEVVALEHFNGRFEGD